MLLTLTVQSAARDDNWTEVRELLRQRETVIEQISKMDPSGSDGTRLDASAAVADQIVGELKRRQGHICAEIRSRAIGSTAKRAYAASGGAGSRLIDASR